MKMLLSVFAVAATAAFGPVSGASSADGPRVASDELCGVGLPAGCVYKPQWLCFAAAKPENKCDPAVEGCVDPD
jgi:hypothetical protein